MNMIFLTFLFPLIGFPAAGVLPRTLVGKPVGPVGVGSIGLSALVDAYVIGNSTSRRRKAATTPWCCGPGCRSRASSPTSPWYVDGLSMTMLGVVVGVGFLIHMFASWYMRGEEGYSRFFAYTNLFIASMVFLVLGDNLLFLYFGWEGVGLCSYLLIGFYYTNRNNGARHSRPLS
jgi:NADH-quinone oxidoreductase subunit L